MRLIAVGAVSLLACGTDQFTGDGGPPDDSGGDATTIPDAFMEADVSADVFGGDAPGTDAIIQKDAAAPCSDPCVTCAQSACGTEGVVCGVDTTCQTVVAKFYLCRCADGGDSCNSPVTNSNDILLSTFANCVKNNCSDCNF